MLPLLVIGYAAVGWWVAIRMVAIAYGVDVRDLGIESPEGIHYLIGFVCGLFWPVTLTGVAAYWSLRRAFERSQR